ncbi:hypothetical protein LIA77_01527 [Sarocladium implicatum]|nr:hypothetical protein LIA77_01527 [Sarocladium implicatum]
MAEAGVGPAHIDNVVPDDEASKWSILWALISIISYAMIQTSFTGYLWNDDTFHGSLWPHRSSPFVCLIDGVADAYLICRALFIRREVKDGESEEPGIQKGTLTKLALFGLGVLPPAIKLFTLRGIPWTQAIAAMYLLPSIIGLFRSLSTSNPTKNIDAFLESLSVSGDSRRREALEALTILCGGIPHLIGAYAFCYRMVDHVGFSASKDVVNTMDWISFILTVVCVLYLGHHMFWASQLKTSPVPFWPMTIILFNTNLCSIPDLVAIPGQRLQRGIVRRWQIAIQYLASFALTCYLTTSLVYHLTHWIYQLVKSWRRPNPDDINPDSPASGPVDGSEPEPTMPLWSRVWTSVRSLVISWFRKPGVDGTWADDLGAVDEEQGTVEEGQLNTAATDGEQSSQTAPEPVSSDSTQQTSNHEPSIITIMFWWLGVWTIKAIIGLLLTVGYMARVYPWAWGQVTERYPVRILINAFGLFNLAMVILYYMVLFDGQGTFAPSWAEVLG